VLGNSKSAVLRKSKSALTTSTVDPANNVITAMPSHLSLWAALGETYWVSLPLVLRRR
jgi:hypothetical protein